MLTSVCVTSFCDYVMIERERKPAAYVVIARCWVATYIPCESDTNIVWYFKHSFVCRNFIWLVLVLMTIPLWSITIEVDCGEIQISTQETCMCIATSNSNSSDWPILPPDTIKLLRVGLYFKNRAIFKKKLFGL